MKIITEEFRDELIEGVKRLDSINFSMFRGFTGLYCADLVFRCTAEKISIIQGFENLSIQEFKIFRIFRFSGFQGFEKTKV